MQLHELKNPLKENKKRIGRGQRARAGHRIRPASRDIIQKLPKLRGVKNKPLKPKAVVVSVGILDKRFKDGDEINAEILFKLGLAKRGRPIKIVSDGTISKSLKIKGLKISKNAKEKILKAGGTIEK